MNASNISRSVNEYRGLIELRTAVADLFAIDANGGWGHDAEPDLVAIDRDHGDLDVAIDNNRFAETTGENEHGKLHP
jgi:hypothetical protein